MRNRKHAKNSMFRLKFPGLMIQPPSSGALSTEVIPVQSSESPVDKRIYFSIMGNGVERSVEIKRTVDGRIRTTTSIEMNPQQGNPMEVLSMIMGTFGPMLPGSVRMSFGSGFNAEGRFLDPMLDGMLDP